MPQKLDEKTKELIAIGCSVAAKCQPCLKYHLKKAEEINLEQWQILEAIRLGKMIGDKSNEFMAEFSDKAVEKEINDKDSSCCSVDNPESCQV